MRLLNQSFALVVVSTGIVATQAQAAVLTVSKTQAAAPTVADDRNLLASGPSATLNGTALTLGEVVVDGTFAKPYIPFLLSASDVNDIATSGATATLGFTGGAQNLSTQTFSLIGFPSRGTSTAPNAGATDFNGGTVVVSGISFLPGTAFQRYNIDVTSFVKTQALANTAMVFRLELSSQTAANTDTLLNNFTINSGDNAANVPTLTIAVPEPTSLAGVGLCAAALLRRRRNSK